MMMRRITYTILMAVMAVTLFVQCQNSSQAKRAKKAKYVFYFIGDGMGVNQVNGTEMFLAEKQGRIGTEKLNFTQFPVVSYATTYSRYNSVTCSAAAGTALASGYKTKNGTIGMDSLREKPLCSVALQAKNSGKKVGIVTSVSLDHATPAAFYAHQPSRSMYYEIATDLPKAAFDFYAGSGFLQERSKVDTTAAPVYEIFQDSAYVVIRGMEEYATKAVGAEKVVFVQQKGKDAGSLPYAIDRREGDLTLAQITKNAIDFLKGKEQEGFFLMVEGGKIDWACHSNDAATVFQEVMDFAAAIQEALDFYRQHPEETLIVVTADHETGGIALGTGSYELNLKALQHQHLSVNALTNELKKLRQSKNNKVGWEEVELLLAEQLGLGREVELTEKQVQRLKEVYKETFTGGEVQLEKQLYSSNEPLAGEAIRILNRISRIGWSSGGHSAGLVPVYAIGVGAELFQGSQDNTAIPGKIAEAAGYNSPCLSDK